MAYFGMPLSPEEMARLRAQALAERGQGADPTGGNQLGVGDKGYLDQLLADDSFMSSMAPQDAEKARLERQMMMAEQLAGSGMAQKHTTPLGAAFAGVADVLNAYRGNKMQKGLDAQVAGLDAKAATGARNRVLLQRAGQAEEARVAGERDAAKAAAEMAQQTQQQGFLSGEKDKDRKASMSELDKRLAAERELAGLKLQGDADALGAKKVEERRKIEGELRNKLLENQQTKDLQNAMPIYKQIVEAPENGVGDMARIYGLAKLFDPSGRVTDSDYSNASNAGGPMGVIGSALQKVKAQGFLDPKTRAAITSEAKRLTGERVKAYRPFEGNFRRLAENYGASPGNVLLDLGTSDFDEPSTGVTNPGAALSPQDMATLKWAKENPNDPDAAAVLRRFGGQ